MLQSMGWQSVRYSLATERTHFRGRKMSVPVLDLYALRFIPCFSLTLPTPADSISQAPVITSFWMHSMQGRCQKKVEVQEEGRVQGIYHPSPLSSRGQCLQKWLPFLCGSSSHQVDPTVIPASFGGLWSLDPGSTFVLLASPVLRVLVASCCFQYLGCLPFLFLASQLLNHYIMHFLS